MTRTAGGLRANVRSRSTNLPTLHSTGKTDRLKGTRGCSSRIHLAIEPGDELAIVPTRRMPATEATANAAHANPTRSGAYQALPATSTRAPRTYRRTASDAATPRDWNIICWRSFIPSGFFMIFLWRYNSMAFTPPDSSAAALKCISLAMHPLRQCSFKMRARGHQRGGHEHAGCIY